SFDRAYRPTVELLWQYEAIHASLHYTGPLLEWIEANEPSFLDLLKKMVDLGLVGRDVPLWSAAARRTVWGYSLRRLKIPKRPPGEEYDFWKAAWLMARSWNRLLDGGDGTAG
ncbi:MAG: hypothetical protein JRN29_03590, partial [Nitrososphaerota archaeon]|nr:hypothetical protein [Nitrososphaerota archaeon]